MKWWKTRRIRLLNRKLAGLQSEAHNLQVYAEVFENSYYVDRYINKKAEIAILNHRITELG